LPQGLDEQLTARSHELPTMALLTTDAADDKTKSVAFFGFTYEERKQSNNNWGGDRKQISNACHFSKLVQETLIVQNMLTDDLMTNT
jgi:hypothetical protein